MEPATRIERATCHRFGPEACLTDSYEGGQPPCTIPSKGTIPFESPQLAGSLISKAPSRFATWSRRLESNQRPAVYETAALPTELRRLFGRKKPLP